VGYGGVCEKDDGEGWNLSAERRIVSYRFAFQCTERTVVYPASNIERTSRAYGAKSTCIKMEAGQQQCISLLMDAGVQGLVCPLCPFNSLVFKMQT